MNLDPFAHLVRFLYYFPLALWIGATAGVAFVALPAIFRESALREAAGRIAELSLVRLDRLKTALAIPFLAASAYRLFAWENPSMLGPALRFTTGAGMVAIDLFSALAVMPRLRALRAHPNAASPGSAERAAFDRLHSRSVVLATLGMVSGAVALSLS